MPSIGMKPPFHPATATAAATATGLSPRLVKVAIAMGAKIATDTVVQIAVDDAYRGRAFSFYDVLFNVAFVAAAAAAALMLPPDGRSVALVIGVAALYASSALYLAHWSRDRDVL